VARRSFRITAILLLLTTTILIVSFVRRHRVSLIARQQQALTPAATITILTVGIGEERIDLTVLRLPLQQSIATVLDAPQQDRDHAALLAGLGDALVAINGGYFDDGFQPVGLCRVDGREVSPLSTRRPLSAVIAIDDQHHLRIVPTADFCGKPPAAIQAGPFVIDSGGVIGVTEAASSRASRSLLAITDRDELLVISTSDASLFAIARVLADAPRLIGCGPVDRAVNLDGGPSTTLFICGQPLRKSGGPVRNYLIFSLAK
jgi:hypothetical protein